MIEVIVNALDAIDPNRAIAHFQHMQEVERMDLDRIIALRELDNLVAFVEFDKFLLDQFLIHELTPTLL